MYSCLKGVCALDSTVNRVSAVQQEHCRHSNLSSRGGKRGEGPLMRPKLACYLHVVNLEMETKRDGEEKGEILKKKRSRTKAICYSLFIKCVK